MAAGSIKNGLDYFPLDVHSNVNFELVEAEFGLEGFAIIIKLLQRIYGGQGYYCEWAEDIALLFSKKIGASGNVVSEIVKSSIRRGIFDEEIYKKYRILTSKEIQDRYLAAVSRRKKVEIEERYLLTDVRDFGNVRLIIKDAANVNINLQSEIKISDKMSEAAKQHEDTQGGINDYQPKSGSRRQQNESKTKEKKYYAEFVMLTEVEFNQLLKEYGRSDTIRMVEILNKYKSSSGRKYISDYAAIKKWVVWALDSEKKKIGRKKYDKLGQYAEIEEKMNEKY